LNTDFLDQETLALQELDDDPELVVVAGFLVVVAGLAVVVAGLAVVVAGLAVVVAGLAVVVAGLAVVGHFPPPHQQELSSH
jgi:Flp pilus assembly protein TadB